MSGKYWDQGLTVAEGCLHGCEVQDKCWERRMHERLKKMPFLGEVMFNPHLLGHPMKRKKPTVYHLWSDIFDLRDDNQAKILEMIDSCKQHKFLTLTKQPENIGMLCLFPIHNLYVGVSVTDQRTADERIPALLNSLWKGKKWVNIEPMMGAVDLARWLGCEVSGFQRGYHPSGQYEEQEVFGYQPPESGEVGIDQVVLGSQTGAGGKEMNSDWARSVRDQCEAAGVPFFLKQMNGGRLLDGRDHSNLIWRTP
uniref:Uncharacterized protein n=1 Tax=viral metagenome TaxID=1070528 RepID=A0A6M3JQ26_9ZZZZ